ncbi:MULTISPECIES: ABC transporter ATP-binding protein [Inquilinus]|uniref:Spermidine/putrescine transport system ATP-binding protein n=1 Tax=Inquilinus ginsengisoli TaxID=363840 RepID=A0ABU1K183_9PROT|nr:ABC transporter ATP-binding protein [Inquilinus ginsengisoli]MDR6294626.1 putative spermidine/putrescine transport system ATP-binding protein [Inquilinus ginsengisoli]
MTDSSSAVRFDHVSRHFGAVRAVNDVSFEIRDGEFFSMLGPSGSGKTTCLRLIAGFEQPTAGHLLLHGRDVSATPPYDRDVNTVFQDYALFPHMSVWENVAYGLMIRRVPKAERRRQAEAMLGMVKLGDFAGRRPAQLSGGQRQRVALARALVNRPSVLLLDEPLGALDLKLREAMQEELKALQRQVGITFVYVTHDQGEALAMSDRVAVFNLGRVEQIDTPSAIYDRPATAFVAGFVGASNMVDAATAGKLMGQDRAFALRPERIRILVDGQAVPADSVEVAGTVDGVSFLGATTRYRVALAPGGAIDVIESNLDTAPKSPGEAVRLSWRRDHAHPLADVAAHPQADVAA